MGDMMMKRVMVVVAAMALPVTLVCAEPSSEVAFDLETLSLLATADPANGQKLSKKCKKCHGESGVSDDPEDTNIAGMRATYLYKQLKDFHGGQRTEHEMNRVARRFKSDQQMADLAVWYASQKPAEQVTPAGTDPAILKLVYHGDPVRMIKACASCHGKHGQGKQFQHARLAGQNPDYFVQTLSDFKDESRTNDVYSRMRIIAEALTYDEIDALAAYYAAAESENDDE